VTTKAYRETGAIDRRRSRADGILRAVDSGGFIKLATLVELLELLGTKTDYRYHVTVEVLPAARSSRRSTTSATPRRRSVDSRRRRRDR
jgi:hypothetical protein